VPRRLEALALALTDKAAATSSQALRAPMPGRLVSLAVAEGESVEAGQTLAVMEAMKMETALSAESAGEVAEILARPGALLSLDDPILRLS
ncbi:MAG: acetyl-CoA carboxylase biotin carboxyl carrier protein subunit, partial [Actinomycetota bacterium]